MEDQRFRAFDAIQILSAGVALWVLLTWKSPWNAQRIIGTTLVIVGGSLLALARYQLGRSFAVRPEAHALVTNGLYSKIRNPVYVFGAVTFAGFILVLQMPLLWIALAALLVVQMLRARREAQVLETAFGDAYREYRRKTWF